MRGSRKPGESFTSLAFRRQITLGAVLWIAVTGTANAEFVASEWTLSTGLSVAGIGKYREVDRTATTTELLAATGELRLSSAARPYYGGLFVDYRLSGSARVDDQFNLGAFFRYNLALWDMTGYVFDHRSVGNPGTVLFAGRARYRIRGNNKIGLEYMSTLRNANYSDITVAYYGSLSDALSFNIGAGRGLVGGPDLQVRFELSWQVR